MIALEGDDFWTDEYKLEKQIDFLENHPEYIAVAHNCVVVGEDSEPNGETYPECKDTEYEFKHFFSEIMPGQFATIMYRNYIIDDDFDKSVLHKGLSPGDRLIYFALLCHGKIYCMQEVMSAYRHITAHGSSFSATHKFNYFKQKVWQQEFLKYVRRHCTDKEIKIAEYQYLNVVIKGFLHKQIPLKQVFSDYKAIKHKVAVIFIGIKRIINKKIFKKTIYA